MVIGGRHVEASSEHRAETSNVRPEVANSERCEWVNSERDDQAIVVVVYDCPHVGCQELSHVSLPGGCLQRVRELAWVSIHCLRTGYALIQKARRIYCLGVT